MSLDRLRTAIVHHWYLMSSGGEKVCESLADVLPQSDFFVLVCDFDRLSPSLQRGRVKTSFLQHWPRALKWHRYYLWAYPWAVEQLDLREYDLVISSDSFVMKGIIPQPEACHICYCYTPMRSAWNMFHENQAQARRLFRLASIPIMGYLRAFDYNAAQRVNFFVTSSENVRRRISRYYGRHAEVISPPCDLDRFHISQTIDDYYLVVSRLVEYKRVDLAIEAFNRSGQKLVIVGHGPEENKLKRIARPNIEFLGWRSDEELTNLYARCRALIFPTFEDFGIVPVEAQASGRPVIAFGRGGALETVAPGLTGIFFNEQTAESLQEAVNNLEKHLADFDPSVIKAHVQKFSKERFQREVRAYIEKCWSIHQAGLNNRSPQVGDWPDRTR